MRDTSKSITVSTCLALFVAASVHAAPPTSQDKPAGLPDDPVLVEHPPELTPEARQKLEDHCAKQHDACAPGTAEAEPAAKPKRKAKSGSAR